MTDYKNEELTQLRDDASDLCNSIIDAMGALNAPVVVSGDFQNMAFLTGIAIGKIQSAILEFQKKNGL